MRAILVPLDGSTLAETAIPTALAIARQTPGTRVDSVVVLETPPVVLQTSGAPVVDRRFDHDLYLELERYGNATRQALTARAPDLPTSLTLLYGDAADRIGEFARAGDYDVIVMTTHGRSGVARAWLGSVADALVRGSHVPTLLLREPSDASHGAGAPLLADVLVPLDEGRVSEEILADVVAMAGGSARVHLVHVLVPSRWLPPPSALEVVTGDGGPSVDEEALESASREAAVRRLARVAEQLRARGVEVTTHTPVHRDAASGILATARDVGASLIAMTTHGRRGAGRLLLGSVADAVLRGATVPVLLRVPTHR